MTKEEIAKLKENKEVRYIYRLPCSLFDGFKYIIVGDFDTKHINDQYYYNIQDWFKLLYSGSLLPYVCATSSRKYRVKEYINIYERPDLLKLRKYVLNLTDENEIIEQCLWGIQVLQEWKVNRIDVFKRKHDKNYVLHEFLDLIEPRFKRSIDAK